MATTNETQSVPFGSGQAWATKLKNADGTAVNPPQTLYIPAIQGIKFEDKIDLKSMHGGKSRALRVAGGKRQTTVSITVGEVYGRLLNDLCFGSGSVIQTSRRIISQKITVPDSRIVQAKIRNNVTFSLGRFDSVLKVELFLNNQWTEISAATTPYATVNKYKNTTRGLFTFNQANAKNSLRVTWVSNGTTIVSTAKVPDSLSLDLKGFEWLTRVFKNTGTTGAGGSDITGSRETFSLIGNAPTGNAFQCSGNGVLVFASGFAVTPALTVTHKTDGMDIKSVIGTLPAAGYFTYIDPPSAATFVSDDGVRLVANANTAMTGVAVGEMLTKSATPTSGNYDNDIEYYQWALADAGDTVAISYVTDYFNVPVTLPDGAAFIADKGVRTMGDLPFTRVAVTDPLAIATNQYAMTGNGNYYFDAINTSDVLMVDFEIEEAGGYTLDLENEDMGKVVTLSLDIQSEVDGNIGKLSLLNLKPKGTGFDTKMDDFAYMQFEFEAAVDKSVGGIGTFSGSVL